MENLCKFSNYSFLFLYLAKCVTLQQRDNVCRSGKRKHRRDTENGYKLSYKEDQIKTIGNGISLCYLIVSDIPVFSHKEKYKNRMFSDISLYNCVYQCYDHHLDNLLKLNTKDKKENIDFFCMECQKFSRLKISISGFYIITHRILYNSIRKSFLRDLAVQHDAWLLPSFSSVILFTPNSTMSQIFHYIYLGH